MKLVEIERVKNVAIERKVRFQIAIKEGGDLEDVYIDGVPYYDSYYGWQIEDEIRELAKGKMDDAKFLYWRVNFKIEDQDEKIEADGYYQENGEFCEGEIQFKENSKGELIFDGSEEQRNEVIQLMKEYKI